MPGKVDIISQLQRDILRLQGCRSVQRDNAPVIDLGLVNAAFPNSVFPLGTIHEFLCPVTEHAAAAAGFISALTGTLMQAGGACIWISVARTLFPPSLKAFGIEPDKVIFIDLQRTRDALWALEEALKCESLAAVVAEIPELGFTQSRRLQLAVEKSHVTGFILRTSSRSVSSTACAARWKITPQPSGIENDLPGVGYPRWQVELLKVRNGKTGAWKIEWSENRFTILQDAPATLDIHDHQLKAG